MYTKTCLRADRKFSLHKFFIGTMLFLHIIFSTQILFGWGRVKNK